MYWYSEKAKNTAVDWRPEIHDSDGLAHVDRQRRAHLAPPQQPAAHHRPRPSSTRTRRVSACSSATANFDHYLDGVYYDRRPSLWIEPQGNWGRGSIQLVEIPTDDEIHDNIVAMWVPAEPVPRRAGAYEFRYRMHWSADEPYPTPLARVVATRLGNGGQAGTARPKGVRKFMVEFHRAAADQAAERRDARARAHRPRAASSPTSSPRPCPTTCPATGAPSSTSPSTGTDPVEMRCYLRNENEVLSETWLYQYHPPF